MVSREQVEQWRLHPNTRYAWRTVDETVDVSVYTGGKALLADLSIGIALDVSFQVLGDWNDPYLTPEQKFYRVGVAGMGSGVSTLAGLGFEGGLAYFGVASGPAGWAGLAFGLIVDYWWNSWVTPRIYEARELNGIPNLQPLGGSTP